jgi:hypothetical protein
MHAATLATPRHGALKIAEMSSAAQKWMIVGVPKAAISSGRASVRDSAPSATTTKFNPVSAADEEPMMT